MSISDLTVAELIGGFLVNLAIALVIVRGIYYRTAQDRDSIFTFLAFNTVIYFVMTFLANTELSVGVGFGLFAIFSVLRYRTSEISTREMTYLFILIALPVVNSALIGGGHWPLVAAANGAVIALLFVLERGWGFRYEMRHTIKYDRLNLIQPEQRDALLAEVRERTGLPIKRVTLGRINYLDDTVELTVYYDEPALPAAGPARPAGTRYVEGRLAAAQGR